MTGCTDRWLQLPEIAKFFGLSEDSIGRLAKNHALPLRRVIPLACPGGLETELITWLKDQPVTGPPARHKRRPRNKAFCKPKTSVRLKEFQEVLSETASAIVSDLLI